jgi:hypothetical protein
MTAYIRSADDATASLHFIDEIVKGCPFVSSKKGAIAETVSNLRY